MNQMKTIAHHLLLQILVGVYSLTQAADIPCGAKALERGKQLLTFHHGPDDRMTIDQTPKQLPPIRNPQDPKQKFDVIEVWGYIYKAQYRMRFIYYNSPNTSCLLMGEEILEYARP